MIHILSLSSLPIHQTLKSVKLSKPNGCAFELALSYPPYIHLQGNSCRHTTLRQVPVLQEIDFWHRDHGEPLKAGTSNLDATLAPGMVAESTIGDTLECKGICVVLLNEEECRISNSRMGRDVFGKIISTP